MPRGRRHRCQTGIVADQELPGTLDEAADRLYGIPPNEFVAMRDRFAESLRAEGNVRLATAIRRLRKPTVSAWAINLLARREPETLAELLALAPAIGKAQRLGRRDELRTLTANRSQLVATLVRTSAAALKDAGQRMSSDVALDIESTLAGALAEPEVAEQVSAGRLERPLPYAGMGPAPALRLVPPIDEDAAEAAAMITPALPDLDELAAEYDAANTRHADAIAEADRIDEERARLRAEHDTLRDRLHELETRLRDADRSINEALREVGRSDRDLQLAKRALDKAHEAHNRAQARRGG